MSMTPTPEAAEALAATLDAQSKDIADAGINGWGNTMRDASALIRAQAARLKNVEADFAALQRAIVGETGASAIGTALEIGRIRAEHSQQAARIAELEAERAAGVPDGFVLVPVEPTPEMVAAFKHRFQHGSIWRERLHAAINAMLAAATTAPLAAGAGWMPIETAPRDGTAVLLAAPGRVTVGEWHPEQWPTASEYHGSTGEYLGQYETGECIPAAWYSWDGGFTEDDPPTGWMPLPAAPTATTPGDAK